MKAYPELRQSRIQWMNHVPSHWTEKRIKYLAQINPPKSEVRGWAEDTEVTFLPMEAIGERGELDTSRSKPIGEVINGYTYFGEGDVLLAKITPCFENGKGAVACGLLNGVGFATTEVIPLRTLGESDSRYLYYLLYADPFRAIAEGSMYGAGGQKRVADSFVANYPTEVPTPSEQATIADFLDREAAKIDTLIDKQEQLIKLLEEKRQAVISHAVTKGLNPNVPMKDSGIEWLGEIPEHWVASPIRFVARLESGHTPSRNHPEYWVDCVVPWITLADVWQIRSGKLNYIRDTKEKISHLGIENSAARLLPKGTVILSRTASVGFSAIMARDMATTQDFANWICGEKLVPEFLLLVLRAMKPSLDRIMMGSTHKTIYMPDIAEMRTPLPPVTEQKKIVENVMESVIAADRSIEMATKAVALLRERRIALISAAVTGKIDVRKAV